jgi:hypothetical protein
LEGERGLKDRAPRRREPYYAVRLTSTGGSLRVVFVSGNIAVQKLELPLVLLGITLDRRTFFVGTDLHRLRSHDASRTHHTEQAPVSTSSNTNISLASPRICGFAVDTRLQGSNCGGAICVTTFCDHGRDCSCSRFRS